MFAVVVVFFTLTSLEIILGIDNILILSILCQRLPRHQRSIGYKAGLGIAMSARLIFLLCIFWTSHLKIHVFQIMNIKVTIHDLIFFIGGAYLLCQVLLEFWNELVKESKETNNSHENENAQKKVSFLNTMVKIALLDIVFSIDTVMTAISMTNNIFIIVAAIVLSILVMVIFIDRIANFLEKNKRIRRLAFALLLLVSFLLIAESFNISLNKWYLYFAVLFSFFVELLNIFSDNVVRRMER